MKAEKAKFLVEKIGRKWIQGKVNDSKYTSSLEITPVTSEFEVGETYEIFCNFDYQKNKYGTKLFLYPLREEDFKNKKIIEDINHLLTYYKLDRYTKAKELIDKLGEDSKADFLDRLDREHEAAMKEKLKSDINYTLSGLRWNYESLQRIGAPSLFNDTIKYINKYLGVALEKAEELEKLKSKIDNEYIYDFEREKEELKRIYTNADIYGKNKLIKKCKKYLIKLNMYDPLTEDILKINEQTLKDILNDKLDLAFAASINLEFLSEESKILHHNLISTNSANQDILRNIFDVKPHSVLLDEVAFMLNDDIKYATSIVEENKDLLAEDNKIYILNIQLDRDDFTTFIKSGVLKEINPYDLRRIGKYCTTMPGIIYKHLIKKGTFSEDMVEQYKENDEKVDDIKTITLLSNIWSPFNYRKELIDNQIYYFVDKEMLGGQYKAYYIVSNDDELDKGFTHRLPYRENFYENKTVKEILDDTFRIQEGFIRIQGDLIFKDLGTISTDDYEMKTETDYIVFSNEEFNYKVTVKDNIRKEFYKNGTLISYEELEKMKSKHRFPITYTLSNSCSNNVEFTHKVNHELRKNTIFLTGELYFYHEKEIFCKNFTITDNKGNCIYQDENLSLITIGDSKEHGEKIKYNIRVVKDIKIHKYSEQENDTRQVITLSNNTDKCVDLPRFNKTQYKISTHTIDGNLGKIRDFNYGMDVRYALGKFSILHPEHRTVTYGEEGHVYEITIGKRHKTQLNY